MAKKYLNRNEQINYLITHKNIASESFDEEVLKENSYSDIVSAFTEIIAIDKVNGNKVYNKPETFEKFKECNVLDETLASCLRDIIGCFEKRFKSFLINKYCGKMADSGDALTSNISWVEDYKNGIEIFDLLPLGSQLYKGATIVTEPSVLSKRIELCDKLISIQNKPSSENELAKHYLNEFGYTPFFLVIQELSLGKLITLFSILSVDDKTEFICDYYNIEKDKIKKPNISTFEENLIRILIMRNIVNHYEPIFPFIINVPNKYFVAFLDLLRRLKKNYSRSVLKCTATYSSMKELSFSGSSYSNGVINKINDVVKIFR